MQHRLGILAVIQFQCFVRKLLKWHAPPLRGLAPLRDHAFYLTLEPLGPALADRTMKLALHFLQRCKALVAVNEFSLSLSLELIY